MDYAVILYFDEESQTMMQHMIDRIADETGCDYMNQEKIPPHITISALISDNETALLSEMEHVAKELRSDNVVFASIGVFNPYVIFLAPVVTDYLLNACKLTNEHLLPYAEVGNRGRYLPNSWVPHAGLAVKLTPEALDSAFDIVREEFRPFAAKVKKVGLFRCEPYEELKVWTLKD